MAPLELWADNPSATLGAGVVTTPAQGTIETWTVIVPTPTAANPAWPTIGANQQFRCLIESELVLVTAGVTTAGTQSWTVTRGAEGTTTATHVNSTSLSLRLTAAQLALFAQIQSPDSSRVRQSANQSIPDQTWTSLAFDTEDWDVNNLHSTSTNTSRLTATVTGKYRITGLVVLTTSVTSTYQSRIWQDGTTSISTNASPLIVGSSIAIPVFAEINLVATHYVELQAYQPSGGAINTDSTQCWFHMQRVDAIGGGSGASISGGQTSNLSGTALSNLSLGVASIPAQASAGLYSITVNNTIVTVNSIVFLNPINMPVAGGAGEATPHVTSVWMDGQPLSGSFVVKYTTNGASAAWTLWYLVAL